MVTQQKSRQSPKIAASPTRCPYCHDAIAPEDFTIGVICERCLSRHHADCWLGECASCHHSLGFSRRSSRKQALTAPLKEAAPNLLLRRIAWSYLGAFALSFPATIVGFTVDTMLGHEALGAAITLGWVGLVATLSLILWALALADAIEHRGRLSSPRLAMLLAALGPITGGLSSFLYYLVWARERGQESAPQIRK